LYKYNQQDRSCSVVLVVFLLFVGFHISLDLVVVVGNSSDGIVFSVLVTSVVGVGVLVGVSCYFSEIIFFATYFALFGSFRATYRARMSSSVSIISSNMVPKVVVGIGVVFAVTLNTGCVSLSLSPAVRLTFSYFIAATHSDAPSKSSKFFTLRRTPST
jgi:hypothetical protein